MPPSSLFPLSTHGELSNSHTRSCPPQLESLPGLTLVLRTESRLLSWVYKAAQQSARARFSASAPTSTPGSCQSKLTPAPQMCLLLGDALCLSAALFPQLSTLLPQLLLSYHFWPFPIALLRCNCLLGGPLHGNGNFSIAGPPLSAHHCKHPAHLVHNWC